YSTSGVLAGAAIVVDVGAPLHGVRVSAERRRRGNAYRLVAADAVPLVRGVDAATGLGERVDRLPIGWAHAFHQIGVVVGGADPDPVTPSLIRARPTVEGVRGAVAVLAPLLEGDAPYR